MEPVGQHGRVLPEHLVDHVIRVELDRGDSDMALGFAAAQGVAAKKQHIAQVTDRWPNSLNVIADPARTKIRFTQSWSVGAIGS